MSIWKFLACCFAGAATVKLIWLLVDVLRERYSDGGRKK